MRTDKIIIFDFGNVLIKLEFERAFRAFEQLLNVDWSDRVLPKILQNAIEEYDRGRISDETFAKSFQRFGEHAELDEIYRTWNSLLGDLPEQNLEFLRSLRLDYRLALLSNINNLHLNAIHNYLSDVHGIDDFEDRFFEKVFYSHIVGKRKPDFEIYDFVQKELGMKGEDILFIDDMEENIIAARQFGWHAFVHKPDQSIRIGLKEYLQKAGFE